MTSLRIIFLSFPDHSLKKWCQEIGNFKILTRLYLREVLLHFDRDTDINTLGRPNMTYILELLSSGFVITKFIQSRMDSIRWLL